MTNIIESSFGLNLRIMESARIFSWKQPSLLFMAQGFVLYSVFIVVVPILAILNLFWTEEPDVLEVNYTVAYLGEAISFILKLFPFIARREKSRKCIQFFADPYFSGYRGERRSILQDYVEVSVKISKVFAIGLGIACSSWCIRPCFVDGFKLPIDIWVPFALEDRPVIYYILFLLMSLSILYLGIAAMLDPLVGGLIGLAAGHLEVLNYDLKILGDYNARTEDMFVKVSRCIQDHNAILRFVEEFEDCFSVALLGQLATSSLILCFCTLQLGKADLLTFGSLVSIACLCIAAGQIFFYCYYGAILFEKHHKLTQGVYMGLWYKYDITTRRSLLILMERSKKPLVVRAAKLLDLSLDTFTMLLRRTYSLFAVLKNFQ